MISIESILNGFIADMNSWEVRCSHRTEACIVGNADFHESEQTGMDEYRAIFETYCDKKLAVPRDYHYTTPPDYVVGGEPILNITYEGHDTAFVETQQIHGFQKKHLYRLILSLDGWRIIDKHVVADDGTLLRASL